MLSLHRREEDIPWRAELDSLQGLKVVHVLSDQVSPCSWLQLLHLPEQEDYPGLKGRVRSELLAPFLSSLGPSGLVLVCGPPGFSREARRLLREECLKEEQIHLFEG